MQPRLKRSALLLALALQGCSLAPTYKAPDLQLPAHYREQSSDGPWHSAQPADQLSTQWWRVYQNERLNSLQQQLPNQKLKCQRQRQQRFQSPSWQ